METVMPNIPLDGTSRLPVWMVPSLIDYYVEQDLPFLPQDANKEQAVDPAC